MVCSRKKECEPHGTGTEYNKGGAGEGHWLFVIIYTKSRIKPPTFSRFPAVPGIPLFLLLS
jgi:hypothetical protein